MSKKKRTTKKKVAPKRKGKTTNIFISKVISGNPYLNEWHMAEKVGGDTYKNLVKVVQPILEKQTIQNNQLGKQKVMGMYEFFTDDFFSDTPFVVNGEWLYSRPLTEDDEILKGYRNVLKAREEAKIQAEAQEKMAKLNQKSNVTEMTQ